VDIRTSLALVQDSPYLSFLSMSTVISVSLFPMPSS